MFSVIFTFNIQDRALACIVIANEDVHVLVELENLIFELLEIY